MMDDLATPTDLTRRNMLRGAAVGVVALPVLAACGGGDSPGGSSTPTGPAAGDVLAEAADIEVGGAVFLDSGIVVTQPTSGDFHAFDRTCTHNQCPVSDIQDGKIHCNCHGSLYDMATGKNVGGPAPAPLTKIDITVTDGEIVKS
jgi:nitrite reductase/ring-hydroxylating ferredoxin subunit